MEEFFLHFIWKYKKFNQEDLCTTSGVQVVVIHPGFDHTSAGPDFRMARLRIDGLEWAGSVEIHVKSSDWYQHGHQNDINYDKVILHVVWTDDRPVVDSCGNAIPTIELKGRIRRSVFDRWKELKADMHWIPCEPFLNELETSFWKGHWERMMIIRLQDRSPQWQLRLQLNHNHWEETFYQVLFRSFGLKENADLFEQVALRTPMRVLRREGHSLDSNRALLIGQAGWYDDSSTKSYYPRLKSKYEVLKAKHQLSSIDSRLWKFGGVRPQNHPNKRLVQLAELLYRRPNFLSDILTMETSRQWFDFCSSTLGSGFGDTKAKVVLLNALVPFFFYYGKWISREDLVERALMWAQTVKPENNRVTKSFLNRGIPIESALDGQAAQHQFIHYCRQKKCVHCSVGKRILNR